MILSPLQAARFYRIFDAMTVLAHDHLGVVSDSELFTGEPPRGLGETAQRQTMDELWEDPARIDSILRAGTPDLPASDLSVAASWKDAYTSLFYVDRLLDGRVAFFSSGYVFDVCGLTLEIGDQLNQLPSMVQATLLPFGERVVYGMFLMEYPVDMGGGMLEVFGRETREALAAGKVISTGAQLREVVPQIKERHLEQELEEFRHDMEMEERAAGPLEGQHAGALVGLDDAAREQAIQEHSREIWASGDAPTAQDFIDERITQGPVITSLAELLKTDELPDASNAGASAVEGLSFEDLGIGAAPTPELLERFEQFKSEIAASLRETPSEELLAEHLSQREGLQRYLEGRSTFELEYLRALAQDGGRRSIPVSSLVMPADMPLAIRGLSYLFLEGDTLEVVMPDEVVPTMGEVDWEAALGVAEAKSRLVRIFDDITDLRGLVPIGDAIAEYLSVTDDPRDAQAVADELMDAIDGDRSSVCVLDTGDELYLLHYVLFWEYLRERDIDPFEVGPYMEGELDDLLEGLLDQQEGKEPRHLTPEMLAERSAFDWLQTLPAVRAMRDFLDAHVPDEKDDYFFAEKVIEDLYEEARWGDVQGSVQVFFDILDANGFMPDESQVKHLVELWMNFCNGVPIWPNNGWSPNELHKSATSGHRVFYNPDGSVMKVGRNDPCPCGSGKKYKRCCGR